jgi:uncharacterized OsmC-like protein
MSDGIRQAMERLRSLFSADPAKARAANAPAAARLMEGLRCEVTGPYGECLVTDMPPAMGGHAAGPNPGWLLRGALASCTATVIAMRAAQLGVRLEALEVLVESETDNRGILGLDDSVSAGMQSLRVKVKIAGAADPASLQQIVAWADEHSPVGCTVRKSVGYTLEVQAA